MARNFPPLGALRAFEAAARHRSFKLAADELHVSPSAISHQVKHLEDILGFDLFHRSARSIELTPAGTKFFPYLRDAFDHIWAGTRAVRAAQRPEVISVQTYSTIAVRWLIPRLGSFRQRHPEIDLRVITTQVDADFDDESIDVGLMIGWPKNPLLNNVYLFSPTIFPVCSPDVAATLDCPAALAKATILQVHPSPSDWLQWLEAQRVDRNDPDTLDLDAIDPDGGLRFDSYDHALKMAARGLGVAIAMQPYAAEDLANGTLVPAFTGKDVPARGVWYISYVENRLKGANSQAFAQWLIQQVENDPDLSGLRDPELVRTFKPRKS